MRKCTEEICIEEHCQHGVDLGMECIDCQKLPFCQRVYDGIRNNCNYNKNFGWNGRCVYCGGIPKPITSLTDGENEK